MGAGRVVAVGRKRRQLESLRDAFGPRVIPAVVTGEADKDLATIRNAARRQRRCRTRFTWARQEHLDDAVVACARSSAAAVWC